MNVDIAVGSTLGGFRVKRLLGRGAMGAVYLAEDVHLQRKAALKVIATELADDDRFRRRFLLESQLAAGLDHPNIVPIYAAGEDQGVIFLAMKYVEGYNLSELIESLDRVGDERALSLLAQVGDALDSAHGLGPRAPRRQAREHPDRHRRAGARLPVRFRARTSRVTVASLTGTAIVGTIAYIAPEQIESGAVDARADVYSLGCVLYECLTGVAPFERDGDLQVVFAHLKEPPPLVTQPASGSAGDDRRRLAEGAREGAGRPLLDLQRARRRSRRGAGGPAARDRAFDAQDDPRRPDVPDHGHPRLHPLHGRARRRGRGTLASSFAEIVQQVVENAKVA
jgi:serine/threonine protein kinase